MRIALICLAALGMGACTPTVVGTGAAVEAVGDSVILTGADTLSKAVDAYTVTAGAVEIAVRAGGFDRNQLLMLQSLNQQALRLINQSDEALTIAQRSAALFTIRDQLRSILGRK